MISNSVITINIPEGLIGLMTPAIALPLTLVASEKRFSLMFTIENAHGFIWASDTARFANKKCIRRSLYQRPKSTVTVTSFLEWTAGHFTRIGTNCAPPDAALVARCNLIVTQRAPPPKKLFYLQSKHRSLDQSCSRLNSWLAQKHVTGTINRRTTWIFRLHD